MDSLGTGGTEWQLAHVSRCMVERGHQLRVVALLPQPDRSSNEVTSALRAAGAEVIDLAASSGWRLHDNLPRLQAELTRFEPDVLHARLFFSRLHSGALRPHRRMRRIHSFHNLYYWQPEKRHHLLLRGTLDAAISRLRTDGFAAVSEAAADCHAAALRIPRDRIRVIPNSVPDHVLEHRPAPTAEVRARYAIGPERPLVATVCRLVSQKGLPTIVEAAARARERFGPFDWVIAGRGPLESSLRAQISEAGLQDTVHLLGRDVAHDEALDLMSAADVFVLASTFEGFPNALAEAMAMGCPAVSTRVGGIPDLVGPAESGCARLVNPKDASALADALSSLLEQPELRATMGRAARTRVREVFGTERIAERWLELYRGGP